MTLQISRDDWNWCVLMLNQALIGAVSPNVRMVTLSHSDSGWTVRAYLDEEDAMDREEFADVSEELAVFLEDIRDELSDEAYLPVQCETVVMPGLLPELEVDRSRVVFKRK